MLKADKELGEARAVYAHCRCKWVRWRTYYRLGEVLPKVATDPHHDMNALQLWHRAALRVHEHVPVPQWQSMWPGMGHDMRDRIARDYGMAAAWGLTHGDELRDEPEETETEWERQRRVDAKAKAAAEDRLRAEIVKRLQREKEGTARRSDRDLTTCYNRSVDVRAIWREFGECNCAWSSCDLCALPEPRR
jgi:hypothetical protein